MVQERQQSKRSIKRPTENLTGIPTQMKIDFEQRSGMSFDDVRVHYHSAEPAKVGALAYTRGEHVYIGPGQEGHLRHELTHVVQQKQGLVTPTGMAGGLPVSNDPELERLAENGTVSPHMQQASHTAVVQRVPTPGEAAANRFLRLVDYEVLTLDGDAIYYELTKIGVPYEIALEAQKKCKDKFLKPGAPYELTDEAKSMRQKEISIRCMAICKEFIEESYNQSPKTKIGADRDENGIQKNADLREILIDVLKTKYIDLIRQGPLSKGPIEYTLIDNYVQGKEWMFKEGIGLMNRLLLLSNAQLPPVEIYDTLFGGSTDVPRSYNETGIQSYGWGAGPSQVMHEQGHHIENNLGVDDFANLHNYLYRHTNPDSPDRVSGWNSLFGETQDTSFGGTGYNIDFPEMNFQNVISRNIHSGNELSLFYLFNGLRGILYIIASLFGLEKYAQEFIDNFYLQESNSNSTSYASLYDPSNYSTEYLSTTAELLSTEIGAETVIKADPARIAIFAYLTNKALFMQIDLEFRRKQKAKGINPICALNDYLSIFYYSSSLDV